MLERLFKRRLSWREVVAMVALLLVAVVLGILDASLLLEKWQDHKDRLEAQAQLLQEEVPPEVMQDLSQDPAFLDWTVYDLSDEDNGILNLDQGDSGLTANAH